MQQIQTLIFDLGGVIINLKTEDDWLKEDLLSNFDAGKLQQLQEQQFFLYFEMGKISVPEFVQQLMVISIDRSATEQAVIHHWNGILKDIPKLRVDLLRKLAEKYHLVLLSNTNHIHMEYIRNYMHKEFGEDILTNIFNTCYYSHEIGMRKPNKEIYEFVLKDQGIAASESLFLDDKIENLIESEKTGIQTFLVDFNKLTHSSLRNLL